MGWSSGSYLGADVWDLVRKYIPIKDRAAIAAKVKDMFDNHDADDWDGESQLEKDIESTSEIPQALKREIEPLIKLRDISDDMIQAMVSGDEKELESATGRFIMCMMQLEAWK